MGIFGTKPALSLDVLVFEFRWERLSPVARFRRPYGYSMKCVLNENYLTNEWAARLTLSTTRTLASGFLESIRSISAVSLPSDNKLYWCDGRLDYIASMNVDGSDRRTLISQLSADVHFMSLLLLHDELLVSDWANR